MNYVNKRRIREVGRLVKNKELWNDTLSLIKRYKKGEINTGNEVRDLSVIKVFGIPMGMKIYKFRADHSINKDNCPMNILLSIFIQEDEVIENYIQYAELFDRVYTYEHMTQKIPGDYVDAIFECKIRENLKGVYESGFIAFNGISFDKADIDMVQKLNFSYKKTETVEQANDSVIKYFTEKIWRE